MLMCCWRRGQFGGEGGDVAGGREVFAEELAVGASPVEVTLAQEGSGNPQAQSQAQVRAIIFEGCQLVQGRLVVFSCGDEVRDFGCSIAGLESGIDLGQDFGLVVFGLGGAAVQQTAITSVNRFNPDAFQPSVIVLAIRWTNATPPGLPARYAKYSKELLKSEPPVPVRFVA